MARVGMVALVLVTAAIVQTALLPHVPLGGFTPDLLLLTTAAFAMRDGAATGVRVGFAAGLLSDLLLHQSAIGLTALVFVGIGYTVGLARPYLAPESVTAPVLLAFLSGLIGIAGFGTLSRLLGDERYTLELVVTNSLVVAVLNTLLSPVVVGVVRLLDASFPIERSARAH
jgi:rod shape-determining protein MreD